MNCIIIGGFLGSGKTSFINYLLKYSGKLFPGVKTALLINEFGEIPVDAAIMDAGSYSMREITGGCICCSLKGMLADAVADIKAKEKPDFLIIEATGLAVPSEIASSVGAAGGAAVFTQLCVDPDQYTKLAGKLAIYDRQLADADMVLLTKKDIRGIEMIDKLSAAFSALYPARMSFDSNSEASAAIISAGQGSIRLDELGSPAHHHHGQHELKDDICQYTHRLKGSIEPDELEAMFRRISENAGIDLFRIKGIVRSSGGWMAVQFAEDQLDLKKTEPPEAKESFVVFIGKCKTVEALKNIL